MAPLFLFFLLSLTSLASAHFLSPHYQPLHISAALLSNDKSLSFATLEQQQQQQQQQRRAEEEEWTQLTHHHHHEQHSSTLTLRLIHRDSPLSPLSHNSTLTRWELLHRRLARDAARVQSLTQRAQMAAAAAQRISSTDLKVDGSRQSVVAADFDGPVVSGLAQGSGEYFTRFGIGTPARDSYMVLDTGSDIVWIQCDPCADCYKQTDPVFNPLRSSSYKTIPCTSPLCSKLDLHGCQPKTNHCLYQVAYGDGSFTTGNFALETFNFKGATMKSVPFGCGHDNEGLFVGAAGLLGLGGGSLSFPSQVGAQFSKKFSYCLVDRAATASSNIVFGNSAAPPGTVFTPLLRNPKLNTFYYVHLAGISVGGTRLSIPASAFQLDVTGNGGVIVDSGTSVTRLVETAYGPLRSAFRAATGHLKFSGGFAVFDTCYDLSSAKDIVDVPTLVLHFGNAADMALPASNYLIPVDNTKTFCFAFASTAGGLSIIGNIQQQGFRVVFDGQTSMVGFAANQCK